MRSKRVVFNFWKNHWHERGRNEDPGKETTDRLRIWNLVGDQSVQKAAVNVNLRIGEVNPLFNECLLFGGPTQQH